MELKNSLFKLQFQIINSLNLWVKEQVQNSSVICNRHGDREKYLQKNAKCTNLFFVSFCCTMIFEFCIYRCYSFEQLTNLALSFTKVQYVATLIAHSSHTLNVGGKDHFTSICQMKNLALERDDECFHLFMWSSQASTTAAQRGKPLKRQFKEICVRVVQSLKSSLTNRYIYRLVFEYL